MRFFQESIELNPLQKWLLEYGRPLLADPELRARTPLDAAQKAVLDQQLQFRKRSRLRFPDPDGWIWTDRSLAQASDWLSACFKSSLFPRGALIADGCCGAGVDSIALAERGPVIAIDRDPWMTALTADNALAHGRRIQVFQEPLTRDSLRGASWLHVDPDRRRDDERIVEAASFSPPLDAIIELFTGLEGGVIKIAPSTRLTESISDFVNQQCCRVWIGSGSECRQQLLLVGGCRLPDISRPAPQQSFVASSGASEENAATMRAPTVETVVDFERTQRVAVLLQAAESGMAQVAAFAAPSRKDSERVAPPIVRQPGRIVYDLHSVLFASDLHEQWAERHALAALEDPLGYYTNTGSGPESVLLPWAQAFEVLDVFAWDDRKVRRWLQHHRVGSVEIKCRLVRLDAAEYQRRYQRSQPGLASLLVTRLEGRVRCIACRRYPSRDEEH
jgi:hypothetical protein